jgi:hypothetical protein
LPSALLSSPAALDIPEAPVRASPGWLANRNPSLY